MITLKVIYWGIFNNNFVQKKCRLIGHWTSKIFFYNIEVLGEGCLKSHVYSKGNRIMVAILAQEWLFQNSELLCLHSLEEQWHDNVARGYGNATIIIDK